MNARENRIKTVALWIILLGVGAAQMTFDALGMRALKGVALATGMSPAPRVFSAAEGLETFSSQFALEWTDARGGPHRLPLTADIYGKITGPYNRRNVYGAVLSYGPVLSRNAPAMFEAVSRYALCGDRPLMKELTGGTDIVGPVRVIVQPLPGTDTGDLPLVLEVACP